MSAGYNEVSEIGAGEPVSVDLKASESAVTPATGARTAPRLPQNRGAG